MVFGNIANGKPYDSSEVTHFLGFEEKVKTKFETPEYNGSGEAHGCVEDKSLPVMYYVLALESEDVALIEYVFENKTDTGPDDDGCY